MKLPRDLSGRDLARALKTFGRPRSQRHPALYDDKPSPARTNPRTRPSPAPGMIEEIAKPKVV